MTDDLIKNLRTRSKVWSGQITKEAHKNLGKFRSLIRVESKTVGEGGRLDIISTGISTTSAKVARAYEFGSGRRSRSSKTSPRQQGPRGFIRIAPKNKKVLAFPWDKVNENTPAGKKFLGVSNTGKALFMYVDHPGVKAANSGKGYLGPAISTVRKQIKKEIPEEIRKSVLGSLRRGFK